MVTLRIAGTKAFCDRAAQLFEWAVVPRQRVKRYKDPSVSLLNISLSDAEMDELKRQVSDAIAFLKEFAPQMQELSAHDGLNSWGLDFGIRQRGNPAETDTFPAELLVAMATNRLDLTLSRYLVSE
jgi:hypothetical protein